MNDIKNLISLKIVPRVTANGTETIICSTELRKKIVT